MTKNKPTSFIDPYYSSGEFFSMSTGGQDAEFKVNELVKLIKRFGSDLPIAFNRVADVGCGTGHTTLIMADKLKPIETEIRVDGYDIHPELDINHGNNNVTFYQDDFTQLDLREPYDLVVLFDVIEHVPDPISFLRDIAERSRFIALHIPLDNSWMAWLRNLPLAKLRHPGHLIVLDMSDSLNLLAFSGLRVRVFSSTPVFRAPSGNMGTSQKMLRPFREMLFWVSPYLLQKTLGGVSLMVIAETHENVQNNKS